MGFPRSIARLSRLSSALLALASGLVPSACGGQDDDPLGGCVITVENGGDRVTTATGSYEETGRIVTAVYVFELDEIGRTIVVNGNVSGGPEWYWTDTFDEGGHLALLEHRDGTRVELTNTYDGDRIMRTYVVPVASGQGYEPGTITYFYDDAENPTLWTRQESAYTGERAVAFTWIRSIENGRVVRAEQQFPDEEVPRGIWTHAFDGDLLTTIERDQGFWDGSDGVPNIRFSWLRDADGRLTSFEQDGTDHNDDPHIDGEPDFSETYSPGCQGLLERFPWLSHVPDRDETTPNFRAPGVWRREPGVD